jgi:hypothetical protein
MIGNVEDLSCSIGYPSKQLRRIVDVQPIQGAPQTVIVEHVSCDPGPQQVVDGLVGVECGLVSSYVFTIHRSDNARIRLGLQNRRHGAIAYVERIECPIGVERHHVIVQPYSQFHQQGCGSD